MRISIPVALAAGAVLAAFAAACGAQAPTAEPTSPQATATAAPADAPAQPSPTPTLTEAADGAAARWATDLEPGGRTGNAAPNATVTLPDGTRTTLEEVAGGKPLLLYFFATW